MRPLQTQLSMVCLEVNPEKKSLNATHGAADIDGLTKPTLIQLAARWFTATTSWRKLYSHSPPCRPGVCHVTLMSPSVVHSQFFESSGSRRSTASKFASLPSSIQTRSQICCVQQFAQFILPLFVVFTNVVSKGAPFTLNQHLARQKRIIHGLEARQLKFIPKILYIICERLLHLANCNMLSPILQQICYDMDSPVSFSNYFLSATSSSDSHWRPSSSLTMMDLDCSSGDTSTTSPDGSQDLKNLDPSKRPGPPSRGAAYYLDTCDSRCDQSSGDYASTPDLQNRLPPDGRSTGSLSAERRMYQDEYLDDYNDYGDDFETSDESIDSMLMEGHPSMYLANNTCYQELNNHIELSSNDGSSTNDGDTLLMEDRVTPTDVIKALLSDHLLLGNDFQNKLKEFQKELNNRSSAWERLKREKDIVFLTGLMWSWIEHLKEPILSKQDLTYIVIRAEKPVNALVRLDKGTRYTTEYLIRFIARLVPNSTNVVDDLLRRLVASLTHQSLNIKGALCPVGAKWPKMREGTTRHLMMFVRGLYDIVTGLQSKTEETKEDIHPSSARSTSNMNGIAVLVDAPFRLPPGAMTRSAPPTLRHWDKQPTQTTIADFYGTTAYAAQMFTFIAKQSPYRVARQCSLSCRKQCHTPIAMVAVESLETPSLT
ncbi:protein tyrosine phosphatase domain-containing protein 1 [Trichonephila clavipes]|nr:protein tyrosine phosphatase domain-containing protein 1 [Trichonephila clavipes]